MRFRRVLTAVVGVAFVLPAWMLSPDQRVTAAVTVPNTPSLVTSFGVNGVATLGAWTHVQSVVEVSGGKLLVALERHGAGGVVQERGVMRLTAAGSVDTTFASSGSSPGTLRLPADTGEWMLVRSSGAILLSGNSVRQYTSDGAVDAAFGTSGVISDQLPGRPFELVDGSIMLSAFNTSRFGGMLLEHRSATGVPIAGGTLFTGLATTQMVPVKMFDGSWRLVTSGDRGSSGALRQNQIVALHPDGSLDTGFGGGSGIVATGSSNEVVAGASTRTGQLLIATRWGGGGNNYWTLSRYTASLALDTTFAAGGSQVGAGLLESMTLNGDGSFFLGVYYYWPLEERDPYDAVVLYLMPGGSFSGDFNPLGVQYGMVFMTELGVSGRSMGSLATVTSNGNVLVARERLDPVPNEPTHAELVRIAVPDHRVVQAVARGAAATARAQRLGAEQP